MKLEDSKVIEHSKEVARFTRAWIETGHIRQAWHCARVARFTRAWIET